MLSQIIYEVARLRQPPLSRAELLKHYTTTLRLARLASTGVRIHPSVPALAGGTAMGCQGRSGSARQYVLARAELRSSGSHVPAVGLPALT